MKIVVISFIIVIALGGCEENYKGTKIVPGPMEQTMACVDRYMKQSNLKESQFLGGAAASSSRPIFKEIVDFCSSLVKEGCVFIYKREKNKSDRVTIHTHKLLSCKGK